MIALHLGTLGRGEEAASCPDRKEPVLGAEEGVVFAEALPFAFHVPEVVRIVLSDLLPVVPEMALNAVFSLEFQVGLFGLFEQG